MKRLASLLLLVVCLATVAGLRAQETEAPLSEADFVRMIQAKAPADQIIAAIRARGISFRLSQQLESDLRTLKISPAVIDLLKAPGHVEVRANAPGGEVAVAGHDGARPLGGRFLRGWRLRRLWTRITRHLPGDSGARRSNGSPARPAARRARRPGRRPRAAPACAR